MTFFDSQAGMSSVAAPFGASTALTDLDSITDEERLRVMVSFSLSRFSFSFMKKRHNYHNEILWKPKSFRKGFASLKQ